jgi:hypothetical protein
MYLLYLDDASSPGNTAEEYLVLIRMLGSADLQVGCLVGLLARARTLPAWTPPVQPL